MAVAVTSPKRILVFGSGGQGKSSLINLLVGKNIHAVGRAAVGFPFEHLESEAGPAPTGTQYTFVDTAGLDEAHKGTNNSMQAFHNLADLLSSQKGTGFCLAVLVYRGDRLTVDCFAKNYDIFVTKLLADMRVPTLLVKLGLEARKDWKQDWYTVPGIDQYGKRVSSPNELVTDMFPLLKAVTGGTACLSCENPRIDPDLMAHYTRNAEETRARVWSAVTQHSLPSNRYVSRTAALNILCRNWDGICSAMETIATVEGFLPPNQRCYKRLILHMLSWAWKAICSAVSRLCNLRVAGRQMPGHQRPWHKARFGGRDMEAALLEVGFTRQEIDARAF